MYLVAGSNLFNQWYSDDSIFRKFRCISKENKCDFDLIKAELIHTSWSYNIYRLNNKYYVSDFGVLTIPVDCSKISANLIIVGNDYNLILANRNSCILWVISLHDYNNVKRINLNIERPLESFSKRRKCDESITKLCVMNDTLVCLTSEGTVYSGLLPGFVDTSHCVGKVIDVHCGYEHYILLTDKGIVYTWGNGRRLQLGHGDVDNVEQPMEVEALCGIKIIKIKAGGWHTLALSEFGDLYVWGWNDTGQLGIKEDCLESCPLPKLIDFYDDNGVENKCNVKDMGCGSRHTAVLLEDNSVWTTGYNKYGQLGLSEEKYPFVKQFKKLFDFKDSCELICGPWCTVLYCNKASST